MYSSLILISYNYFKSVSPSVWLQNTPEELTDLQSCEKSELQNKAAAKYGKS